MDLATILGVILGLSGIFVAFLLEGGTMGAIIQVPALTIIIFGTFGAAAVGTSFSTLVKLPVYLRLACFGRRYDHVGLIEGIGRYAQKARKEGLLALENELEGVEDEFFRRGLQMIVDGAEMTHVKASMEGELEAISQRHRAGILLFQKMGGYSPTMGIIGTVMGLISTLSAAGENPTELVRHIATAFIATLWGVLLANLIWLPLSDKLRHRHEEEEFYRQMLTAGVLSIHAGENPRAVQEKLLVLLPPKQRGQAAGRK